MWSCKLSFLWRIKWKWYRKVYDWLTIIQQDSRKLRQPLDALQLTHPQIYLIVQIQVVELPIGAEVLRASVQREVEAPALALNDHRVPVVIIQQTSCRHGRVAIYGAKLVASWVTWVEKKQGKAITTLCQSRPFIYNTKGGRFSKALSTEVNLGKPTCNYT